MVDVAYACTNIQQVVAEGDTPHIDTWRNARVSVASLTLCINNKTCDIRERNVTIKSEVELRTSVPQWFQDIRE